MSDSLNKIFVWQLGIAALVGVIWALVWELPSDEIGFFFDLPWGFVVGFFWGGVAIALLGIAATIIWGLLRMLEGIDAGFAEWRAGLEDSWNDLGPRFTTDLDRLSGSTAVRETNATLDTWNASPIAWGIAWGVGMLFLWGVIGGLAWGFELGFWVRFLAVLLLSMAGAMTIVGLFRVTETLAGTVGPGYDWAANALGTIDRTWDSWGLPERLGIARQWEAWGLTGFINWGFAGGFAWGVAGFLAAGGLGGGIAQAIVLALAALIGAVVGGIAKVQLKEKWSSWVVSTGARS